jgi:hypothetical protein
MKGDLIPDAHTVARHMRPDKIFEDGRVSFAAYQLRRDRTTGAPKEHEYSVTWLEFVPGDRVDQVDCARDYTRRSLKVKRDDLLGLLNVGEAHQSVRTSGQGVLSIEITHDPVVPNNPAHALIGGFSVDNERQIADCLAEATATVVPAVVAPY